MTIEKSCSDIYGKVTVQNGQQSEAKRRQSLIILTHITATSVGDEVLVEEHPLYSCPVTVCEGP